MKKAELMTTGFRRVAAQLASWQAVAVGLLLVALLLLPQTSQSQIPFLSPCCGILAAGLGSVTDAVTDVIGRGLNAVNLVLTSIEEFQRLAVWPEELIDEARATVGSVQGIYARARGIGETAVASATLPGPGQLEQTLLSRNPAQIAQVSSEYANVYLDVPPPNDASSEVRNLIDMTDGVAQAAMKRAITIDALADLQLEAANEILAEIQVAAPGSAPILEAGAAAWLVRANAYTQAALGELMRLRAIDLANAGAEMKIDVQRATEIRDNVDDALRRR